MAQVYNSDLLKELRDASKLQQLSESIPNQLDTKIVPVIEVNPKLLRSINVVKDATATNATSTNLYTTPSDRDFFLVGYSLSVIKDATSTSTATSIRGVMDGVTIVLARIPGITLTAQSESIFLVFDKPLKFDRGTTFTITHTTNVANIVGVGVLYGYTVENTNA